MSCLIVITVSNETAKTSVSGLWWVMSEKRKKSIPRNAIVASVKKEMEKPRKTRSAKMAELSLFTARIRRSVPSSASGTVHKIVLARSKTEPAKVQGVDLTTNCIETC